MSQHFITFDLERFLPYLLTQAAEATSQAFQERYRKDHGLNRVQWRILANLGKFGSMTATEICRISYIDKTKVSRAVAHLQEQAYLQRSPSHFDRRSEILSLTDLGQEVFSALGQRALHFDHALRGLLGPEKAEDFERCLQIIYRKSRRIRENQDG